MNLPVGYMTRILTSATSKVSIAVAALSAFLEAGGFAGKAVAVWSRININTTGVFRRRNRKNTPSGAERLVPLANGDKKATSP
jgi:hypothetical protein